MKCCYFSFLICNRKYSFTLSYLLTFVVVKKYRKIMEHIENNMKYITPPFNSFTKKKKSLRMKLQNENFFFFFFALEFI